MLINLSVQSWASYVSNEVYSSALARAQFLTIGQLAPKAASALLNSGTLLSTCERSTLTGRGWHQFGLRDGRGGLFSVRNIAVFHILLFVLVNNYNNRVSSKKDSIFYEFLHRIGFIGTHRKYLSEIMFT
jgi:hypothetical protein